ncbi:MAG: hypothetical protein WC100_12045 [Sterolibacterium sp.]
MSYESRLNALGSIYLGSGLGTHQVSGDTRRKRASILDLKAVRMFKQAARKARQLVLELLGWGEVVVNLDQQKTNNRSSIVDIYAPVRKIFPICEINHDGSLKITLLRIDDRGCLHRINLSNLGGDK